MSTVADCASDREPSVQDWMLDQIAGEGPAIIVTAKHHFGGDEHENPTDHSGADGDGLVTAHESPATHDTPTSRRPTHDLDIPADDSPIGTSKVDIDAGAKRTAVWLGSAVLLVAVGIVLAFVVFGAGPDPTSPPARHAPSLSVTAAPTTAKPAMPQKDQAVPFTAQTDSCTPTGVSADQSTGRSPQALTDTGTDSAWVCGRGPQESRVDGQILHVQFGCAATPPASGCSYMLNAVSVTPGWVAKTTAGHNDWLGHRVVRLLQFNFFDGSLLAADPFFLDTHSVPGPVTVPLPSNILASRVDVIILHTERPPTTPLSPISAAPQGPDATDPAPGGPVGPVPAPGTSDPVAPPLDESAVGTVGVDPVDATFAISQMQFLGHPPH
jgi:hypothetical protein